MVVTAVSAASFPTNVGLHPSLNFEPLQKVFDRLVVLVHDETDMLAIASITSAGDSVAGMLRTFFSTTLWKCSTCLLFVISKTGRGWISYGQSVKFWKDPEEGGHQSRWVDGLRQLPIHCDLRIHHAQAVDDH